MIQRNSNSRKRRSKRSSNRQLEFGKLEDRKLLAADMLLTPALPGSTGDSVAVHA